MESHCFIDEKDNFVFGAGFIVPKIVIRLMGWISKSVDIFCSISLTDSRFLYPEFKIITIKFYFHLPTWSQAKLNMSNVFSAVNLHFLFAQQYTKLHRLVTLQKVLVFFRLSHIAKSIWNRGFWTTSWWTHQGR
jgi:hypothetical protein